LRQIVVHVSNGNAHLYGGQVISRVIAFNERFGLKANPANVFAELSFQMAVDNPHTLVQACLTEADEVVGHAVTMVQDLYGYRTAMIYQLAIDDSARNSTREAMLQDGFNQISSFAEAAGCKAIRAWAQNKKLTEVFNRFGLKNKEFAFIEKEL